MDQDKNLLFGLLALQMSFISKDAFLVGSSAAITSEQQLRDCLIAQHAIGEVQAGSIDTLAAALENAHGTATGALTALGVSPEVRDGLASLDIGEVEETLASFSPGRLGSGPIVLSREREDRYEQRSEIARGGVGRIMLAYDKDCGREVAYKVLLAAGPQDERETRKSAVTDRGMTTHSMAERFVEEAKVCAQLVHPNIVPVYEVGADKTDTAYYTMPVIRGQTMTEAINEYHEARRGLARHGRSTVSGEGGRQLALMRARLYQAFVDTCQAISYAHAQDVIHRDVKPDNIMLGEFGETILLDWGLAKVKGRRDRAAEDLQKTIVTSLRGKTGLVTIQGTVLGTPSFMPPEQAEGRIDEVDEQSDVYSLGAILYTILCGSPPFIGEDALETLALVVRHTLEPPSVKLAKSDTRPTDAIDKRRETDKAVLAERLARVRDLAVPLLLEKICLKCLERNKEHRFASVAELAEEMSKLMEGTKQREYMQELCKERLIEARKVVDQYWEKLRGLRQLERRIEQEREQAKPYQPIHEKQNLWAAEAEVKEVKRRVDELYDDAHSELAATISLHPDNVDARAAMSDFHWSHFLRAERDEDQDRMHFHRSYVETYHDGRLSRELCGDGSITLVSNPGRAEVYAFKYVELEKRLFPIPLDVVTGNTMPLAEWSERYREHLGNWLGKDWADSTAPTEGTEKLKAPMPPPGDRRYLEPGFTLYPVFCDEFNLAGKTGRHDGMEVADFTQLWKGAAYDDRTAAPLPEPQNLHPKCGEPLIIDPLPMGSYLFVLRRKDFRDTHVPVHLSRFRKWTQGVNLFSDQEIGADFVHVPAGPFLCGGSQGFNVRERSEPFVDDVFVARYPVTFERYLAFCNALKETDEEEAGKYIPHLTADVAGAALDGSGNYAALPGIVEGDIRKRYSGRPGFEMQCPVVGINYHAAMSYRDWLNKYTDLKGHAIADDAIWEKAMRGVDGRLSPMGNEWDATFAKFRESTEEAAAPEPVGMYPAAESVYGVRDAIGGVHSWIDTWFNSSHSSRVIRGGSWNLVSTFTRFCESRFEYSPDKALSNIGLRLVRIPKA